jgi:hypothetical protein
LAARCRKEAPVQSQLFVALPTLTLANLNAPFGSISRIRRNDLNDRDMNEGNDQAPALKVPSVARADPGAAAR